MTTTNGRIDELTKQVAQLESDVNDLAQVINHFYGTAFPLRRGKETVEGNGNAFNQERSKDQTSYGKDLWQEKGSQGFLRQRKQGAD